MDTANLLLGPIFHHHLNDVYCLIIFNKQVKKITFDLKVAKGLSDSYEKAKTIGRATIVGKGANFREVKVSPKFFAYVSKLEVSADQREKLDSSKSHFYRLVVGDAPIDFHASQKKARSSNARKVFASRLLKNGWLGPVDVLRTPKQVSNKAIVSCFDAARKKSPGGLKLLVSRLIKRESSYKPQAIYLLGDQIYADDQEIAWREVCNEAGSKLSCQRPKKLNYSKLDRASEHELPLLGPKEHLQTQFEYLSAYLIIYGWGASTFAKSALDKKSSSLLARNRELVSRMQKESENFSILMLMFPTVWMWDDHDITDDWNLQENPKGKFEKLQTRSIASGLGPLALIQRPMMFLEDKKLKFPKDTTKNPDEIKSKIKAQAKTTLIGSRTLVLENRVTRKYGAGRDTELIEVDMLADGVLKDLNVRSFKTVGGLSRPPLVSREVSDTIKGKGFEVVIQTHPLSPLNFVKGNAIMRGPKSSDISNYGSFIEKLIDMEAMDYYPDDLGKFISSISRATYIYSGDIHAGYIRNMVFYTSRDTAKSTPSRFTIASAGALKNQNMVLVRKALKSSSDVGEDRFTIRAYIKVKDKDYLIWFLAPSRQKLPEFSTLDNVKSHVADQLNQLIANEDRLIKFLEDLDALTDQQAILINEAKARKSRLAELKNLLTGGIQIEQIDIYVLSPLQAKLTQNSANFIHKLEKKIDLVSTSKKKEI